MNKSEFVDSLAAKADLSKADAARATDAFLETVTDTLKSGGEIVLTGFGKFSVQHRAAREGVNPRDRNQRIHIAAARVPKFSAGSGLKSAVKGG